MMAWFFLLALWCLPAKTASATNLLYNYGTQFGDLTVGTGYGDTGKGLTFTNGLPFGGGNIQDFIVLIGGSLYGDVQAIYYFDIFYNERTYNSYGEVYYRYTEDQAILDRVSSDVAECFTTDGAGFQATRAAVVTWISIVPYRTTYFGPNTFQVVVATDGSKSFALYNYLRVDWWEPVPDTLVGTNYDFENLPFSNEEILRLDETSNSGMPGRWMFRVDQQNIIPADSCVTKANPCQNGGTCSVIYTKPFYECSCPFDYTGVSCETSINDCHRWACLFGRCVDGIGSYTCECFSGYTGNRCQEPIQVPAPAPVPIPVPAPVPTPASTPTPCVCFNGGLCNLLGGCTCLFGYSGPRCEIGPSSTPAPVSTPANCQCRNGGICNVFGGCICPTKFIGEYCETAVLPPGCSPTLCQNGGTCQTGGVCDCPEGYSGSTCQLKDPVLVSGAICLSAVSLCLAVLFVAVCFML